MHLSGNGVRLPYRSSIGLRSVSAVERVAILVDAYTTTMIKNEIMGFLLAW